jgi:hypothetical protein
MKPQAEMTDAMADQILSGVDESKLSEWEKGFITSLRSWRKKGGKLSEKQAKRLKELWEGQHKP